MYKIYKVSTNETIDFAASELKKYLRMMAPDCGGITIEYNPEATDGFRLGLLEQFGLPSEAEDPVWDDVVHVETTEDGGILAGSNFRSVLFAVYRFLKLNGCRFLLPGKDGEYIPRKKPEPQSYHHMADNRLRAHATEGDPSLEQVLDYIDYHAKQELNGYGLLGIYGYHRRYYNHRLNENNRPPEPVDRELVLQWQGLCDAELTKRGMDIRGGGHMWTEITIGLDPDKRYAYKFEGVPCPEEPKKNMAMLGGVRDLNRKDIVFTNFCMSRADLRTKFATAVADYAEAHPEFSTLGMSLADTSHNHCECPDCVKKRPSDWLVMIANEADELLTKRNLPTKLIVSSYVDCMFPPVTEKLKNPKRFFVQFCPISRKYTSSITADTVYPEHNPEYVRNAWTPPKSMEGCVALFKEWQKACPECDSVMYEYHFWRHQFRDPGMMTLSRRIYDDMRALPYIGVKGCLQDGSNRNFFPTGFMKYIWAATMLDRNTDYEATLADYFYHCYGEDWKEVRTYLEKVSEVFNLDYVYGNCSVDPKKGDFYNPAHAENLKQVKELAAGMRLLVKSHMQMPTRVQNVCWRLLLRHAEYIEGVAEFMTEKALGHDRLALEKAYAFFESFGKYEYEIERYFDNGLAMDSWEVFAKTLPQIEL